MGMGRGDGLWAWGMGHSDGVWAWGMGREPGRTHQLLGSEGATLLPEDEQVPHAQGHEQLPPAWHVIVRPQVARVYQHPVHT